MRLRKVPLDGKASLDVLKFRLDIFDPTKPSQHLLGFG
jgi:hypothetical protein